MDLVPGCLCFGIDPDGCLRLIYNQGQEGNYGPGRLAQGCRVDYPLNFLNMVSLIFTILG